MTPSDDTIANKWYERKSAILERALGKEHDLVGHSIIPYALGGALDLYYYPNGIKGTAIATKELSDFPGEGSTNEEFDCYELVMFTHRPILLEPLRVESAKSDPTHAMMNSVLNCIARYSADASLNPNETCDFPAEMEGIGGTCLIFDEYAREIDPVAGTFGLLAIIRIFRSEMEFAQRIGGGELIQLLKKAGHYPYSDVDRKPVA